MLPGWEPVEERVADTVTSGPVARLAAALDRPSPGPELPPLWHWLFFLPATAREALGADGHARRGGFLPPVGLRRRMIGGGHIELHAPLRIGDAVERTGSVVDVQEKRGRRGPLVLVRVRYRIVGPAGLALVEDQTLAYTDAPPGPPLPAGGPPPDASWSASATTDPVLLFRFSALTFNAHRIHYDAPYATGTEGYPGLVVHGPLVAVLLAGLAGDHDDRRLGAFSYRALAPFHAGETLLLRGEPHGAGADLGAYRADGTLGMTAQASFS